MRRRAAFPLVILIALTAHAQTINLQGVVSNSANQPIAHAIATLVRLNMKDTTGVDGKYSFSGAVTSNLPVIVPRAEEISIENGIVRFTLSNFSPIKIEIFNLRGHLLKKAIMTGVGAGIYRFNLAKTCPATNLLLVKAVVGSREVSFPYMALNNGKYGVTPSMANASSTRGEFAKMAAFVDTLKVTADGFQTKTVAITSYENQQQNISLDSSAKGKEWPTANPAAAGPFEVAVYKNVGPLAGIAKDPIYGEQKRFNVYCPKNLATSGYLHPIVIWANGFKDNPEENPPKCVIDRNQQWCGQYLPMLQHLASHGFVVIASLSTATADGDPLPTLAGLDWIIKQNYDSVGSPYYHRLDTSKIGQLGHSYGGMSTCKSAADPRYKALMTICGTSELSGVHTPMLFYCGGKDDVVKCDGVKKIFQTVTNQPAFFISEFESNHGWWVYQGANGVSLSSAAAWFRIHLMNDTANRKYFYGPNCTFCSDNRVKVERNSLMTQ